MLSDSVDPLEFNGFPFRSFQFLQNLRQHNEKAWFEAHKAEYRRFILEPMQALAGRLGAVMLGIDPLLEVAPAVNKTISRIYRDTRFSKDKSPYKTNQWLTFKRPNREWQNRPAYFFAISPESIQFGMGFYAADRATMDRWRADVDADPAAFLAATRFFAHGRFALEGERYRRPLRPQLPPAMQDWVDRKSFYLVNSQAVGKRGVPAAFADELAAAFEELAPLYCYLARIVQP